MLIQRKIALKSNFNIMDFKGTLQKSYRENPWENRNIQPTYEKF